MDHPRGVTVDITVDSMEAGDTGRVYGTHRYWDCMDGNGTWAKSIALHRMVFMGG